MSHAEQPAELSAEPHAELPAGPPAGGDAGGRAGLPAKPPHIFNRDDDWQALGSFATDQSPQATLGIVSGRWRQGKTYLLSALAQALGGFYFEATEATEAESLRMFGAVLARHTAAAAPYAFESWQAAIAAMFTLARQRPVPLVIDEFPYLTRVSPELPSLIQRELDARGLSQPEAGFARLLLCGSAMSVMGRLLAGNTPLRGRAGLEMLVRPLEPVDAARFWGLVEHPKLAVMVHAIVGGTPAYRRQFVRDDAPDGPADFDAWVRRTVLNPRTPLFREARYLLAEEVEIRDTALYHSVLAAIAEGNRTRGGVANYIGRRAGDISHPLTVLEDAGLISREPDAFRTGRTLYRISEPLLVFYQAIMRPRWRRLELGDAAAVWRDARHRFDAQVVGPHFEALCRHHALRTGGGWLDAEPGDVLAGTVADPAHRVQHELDVVVFAPAEPHRPRRVLGLGEVKWGERIGVRHLERLRRVRDLLAAKGEDVRDAVLICYGAAGFDSGLADTAGRDRLRLFSPADLYAGPSREPAGRP